MPSLRTLGTGAQQALPGNTASLPPSGSAGGDLTGTYPNPTLAAIGSATGPTGDTTHVAVVTIDAKGRVTALTSAAIAFPADAVTSVFGRTGAVVSASNDYSIGQISGAADAIGGTIWTTITKPSDTSRNTTTTVTIDPHLQFTAAANGVYDIEIVGLYLSAAGGNVPDFKGVTGEDNQTRGILYFAGISTSDAWQTGTSQSNTSGTAFGVGTQTTLRGFWLKGLYVGGGGTFGLYWSQFTSNGNDTTLKAGSVLRYRKIG